MFMFISRRSALAMIILSRIVLIRGDPGTKVSRLRSKFRHAIANNNSERLPVDAPCDFMDFNRCEQGLVCSPSRTIRSMRQLQLQHPGSARPVGPLDTHSSKPTLPMLVNRSSTSTTKHRHHRSPPEASTTRPPALAGRRRNNSCGTAAGFGCSCQHRRISKRKINLLKKRRLFDGGIEEWTEYMLRDSRRYGGNTLLLIVHSGKDLADMDKTLNNRSDPFVKISFSDGRSMETKVIDDSLNPDFNFKFQITLTEGNVKISLTVWDKDPFFKDDDVVGFAVPFSTADIPPEGWEGDLRLNYLNDDKVIEYRGTIGVSCRWIYNPQIMSEP